MMTNVDFEGFDDWSDDELLEAKTVIDNILHLRKKERIENALKMVGDAFIALQSVTEEIEHIELDDVYLSLGGIFESIKNHYKERMD